MRRRLRAFLCEEQGAVTIEFILWMPIVVALLVTAIDGTMLYVTHTEMWNVSRDTARRMVTGKIRTVEEAEAYAVNAMSLRELPYGVFAYYDADNVVEFRMAISFSDISIAGYGSPLLIFGTEMMARVVMRPDKRIPFGSGS